jgi:hypothetical protein
MYRKTTRGASLAVALSALALLAGASAAHATQYSCAIRAQTDSYQANSTTPYNWPFTIHGGTATCLDQGTQTVRSGTFALEGNVYDWNHPLMSPLFTGSSDFCYVMVNGQAKLTLDGDAGTPFSFAWRSGYTGLGPIPTKWIAPYSGTTTEPSPDYRTEIGTGTGEYRPTPFGSDQWARVCVPSETLSGFTLNADLGIKTP